MSKPNRDQAEQAEVPKCRLVDLQTPVFQMLLWNL